MCPLSKAYAMCTECKIRKKGATQCVAPLDINENAPTLVSTTNTARSWTGKDGAFGGPEHSVSELNGVGQVSTALPPVRIIALRPQYGRNDASVATRGAYLPQHLCNP